MHETLTVGSLFAGIGGFDLGFDRAGYSTRWRCEIEPFCQTVLNTKMPGVVTLPDVREIDGRSVAGIDVLCGGFPCQDVSVAGEGAGLDGERSGLFFQMARIVSELQPRWVVIENVPGLLSNRAGRDFATVLVELVERGYGVAWRILDSQYFGLAQRRDRVFLVCRAGTRSDDSETVLFERPRSAWGIETREEARTDVAATLRGSSARRGVHEPGRGGEDDSNLVCYALRENERNTSQGPGNYVIAPAIAACLNPGHEAKHSYAGDGGTLNLIAHALTATMHKRHDEDTDTLIANTLLSGTGGTRTDDLNQTFTPTQYGVRRLTPLECERLQGFPDGWTCLCGDGHRGSSFCKCKDAPRYRALGNAVSVPVAQWIAERIQEAEVLDHARVRGHEEP